MDSSAIDIIQQTAIEAAKANQLKTHIPAIIGRSQSGPVTVSLEHLQEHRSRYRGVFATSSIMDFAAYVKLSVTEGNPAPGFVDLDSMVAVAYFNLGTVDKPGHADWYAKLRLKKTAPFEALCAIDGKALGQKALSDWLEDWADYLSPQYADSVAKPGEPTITNGTLLARAVQAVRKVTIHAKAESTHKTGNFDNSSSAFASIEAAAEQNDLPTGFAFTCQPYAGLPERTFRLPLSLLTGGEKPALVMRWQQREDSVERIARDFKRVLTDQCGTSAYLVIGTFTP